MRFCCSAINSIVSAMSAPSILGRFSAAYPFSQPGQAREDSALLRPMSAGNRGSAGMRAAMPARCALAPVMEALMR